MTILFTVYLYFAVCLFLNKKTHIIEVLGVIFSSPGQRPCELLPSLGIRPSVVRRKLSHLNLLL